MKLTICQIAKLFLLLTAFSFHNSPSAVSLAFSFYPTSSSSATTSSSVSSSSLAVSVLAPKTATDFAAAPATTSVAAKRTSAATTAATTAPSSNSIWPTATQANSPRNAREAERQKRQKQQPATQEQHQQHQRPQQQQQHQQLPLQRQRQRRQKLQKLQQPQRLGVLIPSTLHTDMMHVQQGFNNFLDFFQLHLSNASVDFLRDVGEYTEHTPDQGPTHQQHPKNIPGTSLFARKSLLTCI